MKIPLNFRQKIVLSHLLLLIIFFIFSFFFIGKFLPSNLFCLAYCAMGLIVFGANIWLIFHRIHYPLQQIMKAIQPYQQGQEETLSPIILSKSIDKHDDFYQLAETLNSLSDHLRLQIKDISNERHKQEAILEKVIEMGKDFVANASHELRTPITIIKGFAETLQDLPELPCEMVVDIIEKIVRNCQRMESLVQNLLTLADLENLPDSHFQECDLFSLIETCQQVVRSVYEDAQITIEKSDEMITETNILETAVGDGKMAQDFDSASLKAKNPFTNWECESLALSDAESKSWAILPSRTAVSRMIKAYPGIFELAIINILDNAVKYSNPPAQITINLKYLDNETIICICDTGIGIPPADLEHIFERFYTVDKARSRRLGGVGLGLSITRTIIEKHRGTITASSSVGAGTQFTIRLPL